MTLYDVVVVGATGLVGRKILQVLEERGFPVDRVVPVASPKSLGMEIMYKDRRLHVQELSDAAFVHAEIAFFAAGGDVSKRWVPVAAKYCDIVIDNSSEFRLDHEVPLVIPEVNPRAIFTSRSRIIANPNCSTIQMLVALKPLHDAFRVRRIVVATYQAVSGAGQRGMLQLQQEQHRHPVDNPVFPHPVSNNVLPQIGVFFHDGYSKEEYKMIDETRKILGDARMRVAPTCARVPVANCHSEAVTVEFEKPFELDAARRILAAAPGVVLTDAADESAYPLCTMADGRDEVFVGRVRRDLSAPNSLSMWIVADNLRKGAATNAVQIAEAWLRGPAAFKVAV